MTNQKAEPGYRFYALYDKIGREDILAHAYARRRSNKGAPGVDGQDFEDVEAYGVQRWLGELAVALRQETYQPAPTRRVFIPKANGKLRPLGISTLRDRVCMTAAMLVLESKVRVYDFRVATKQQFFQLEHRLSGVSSGTVGVQFRWKVGFKDTFRPIAAGQSAIAEIGS